MNRFAADPVAMEQSSDEIIALRTRMMMAHEAARSALTALNAMEGFSQVLTPLTRLMHRCEDRGSRFRELSRALQTAAGLYRQNEERCVDTVTRAVPALEGKPGWGAYWGPSGPGQEPEWYISPARQTMISRDVLNAIFR